MDPHEVCRISAAFCLAKESVPSRVDSARDWGMQTGQKAVQRGWCRMDPWFRTFIDSERGNGNEGEENAGAFRGLGSGQRRQRCGDGGIYTGYDCHHGESG